MAGVPPRAGPLCHGGKSCDSARTPMSLSLAAQLRDPHPPPRPGRLRRWLLWGVLELAAVAGLGWWYARTGAEHLALAARAVHDSEAALLAATRGSVKFAYAVANTSREDHAGLFLRAEEVDRDQPLEDRVRAAEALDREVAYVLANPPPPLEPLWRRMRASLPGIAKTREADKLNVTLARGRWREAATSYAAQLAIYLKLAPPPPAAK
jgi:hypothetical protein